MAYTALNRFRREIERVKIVRTYMFIGLGVDLNACTAQGSALPQFLGNSSLWGRPIGIEFESYIHTYIHALYHTYVYSCIACIGGAVNESGCDNIPEYPFCSGVRQDNMRTLCKQSFEVGLRIANNPTNSNPTINKMCQVKCPRSLWTATGAFLLYIYIYTYIPKRFSQRNSWAFFGSTLYKGINQS
jgi:hypothetical protein